MSGQAGPDPFEWLETTARRRAWIFGGACGGLLGGLVLIAALVSLPGPGELTSYLASIGTMLAIAIGLPLFLAWESKHSIRSLRPLGPHVAAAGALMTRGIMVVLHDGMVLMFPGGSVACVMFFGPGGIVLHPSLEEAVHWTRVGFTKRLGTVGQRRGPALVQAELKALQARIGEAASGCVVRQARVPSADPTQPQWVVWVVFFSVFNPFKAPRVDPVATELTTIEALLRRALVHFAPAAGVAPRA